LNIGSVEGLVIGLLFIVPGGLGIALRRSIYAAHTPSAFSELLHALGAALASLLLTEGVFVVVDKSSEGVGDYILEPLIKTNRFPDEVDWLAYFLFALAALVLPTAGAWARRTRPARRILGNISPHADGLDYIIHEARPRDLRDQEIWTTVNTTGDEALLGQLAWRSTAPDPLELVLTRVRDLNDPSEEDQEPGWFVWLRGDSIRAVWIHVPEE
jgi:hypothetical protein